MIFAPSLGAIIHNAPRYKMDESYTIHYRKIVKKANEKANSQKRGTIINILFIVPITPLLQAHAR